MKKKLFLVIFSLLEINENIYIYIYNEKRKKNLVQNLEICYCPICIVRKETVLQYSLLVLDCIAGCMAKLYCNRQDSIAREAGLKTGRLYRNTHIVL